MVYRRGIKMSKDKVPINISIELYKEIENKIKSNQGEFQKVEDYIEFVLREVMKDEELEQVYTPEEEKKIKNRLKSLGYM